VPENNVLTSTYLGSWEPSTIRSIFAGREIVLAWGKGVVRRDVTGKRIEDTGRQRVIENVTAAANYRCLSSQVTCEENGQKKQ